MSWACSRATETAVRYIASSYSYTSHDGSALSLRDGAEEITRRPSAEIADRVRPAGVAIIESRLTRLSYAPEIAQAMQRLREEDVVEPDEEGKAAMVSNLLVVLCSEQATQQVVNTGSLYQ